MSDTAKSINLLRMIKGSDMTSSQEVSQSVPQSTLSPVLAKYKQYLQSCYNARVLAPADKYLPTLESPYINLAMIRRGRYNPEQRDEFTRRTLHGGVDQILENKTPINIEDLLTPEDRDKRYQKRVEGCEWLIHEDSERPISAVNFKCLSDSDSQGFHPLSKMSEDIGRHTECSMVPKYSKFPFTQRAPSQTAEGSKKPVRFILVEGPPGIGKSTFAWEVCRRWDEIESLRYYHTVVLLKLREKWVLNATSLSDLFRCPFLPEFSKNLVQDLHFNKCLGPRLLLVLDGFDEVFHSFHENSVIKSILCRKLLPECTIILTTRPVAKATLRSICQPRIDKHVEIIGFTEEERVRYITEVFSEEPELQANFLKYMFLVPHIKSMMYIPLNCAIIAQVYYESQSSHHLAIPRTRTQLYKALTHSLLVRHMKMKESKCEYTFMLPEGLDEEHQKKFKTLAKFAFDAHHKGKSRKVTFFKEDIPEGLVHFGFMNESTEIYVSKAVEKTLSFLHLSLQEYLAAWHLADSYSIEFQVAYHWLASYSAIEYRDEVIIYKGDNKEEEALISSLRQQRSSLVEPAIFLAGITGWRCQSEDDRNHWEMYLSRDIVHDRNPSPANVSGLGVLLRSLYEAQNSTLLPHYFAAERGSNRREISIGSFKSSAQQLAIHTPYDCYALSYCLAHSSDQFSLSIGISRDDEVALVETLVKGLKDHCKSTTPRVTKLKIYQTTESVQNSNNCLFWLIKANCWTELKEMQLRSNSSVSHDRAYMFLEKLVKVEFIAICIPSWEWLPALKCLSNCKLKGFDINNTNALVKTEALYDSQVSSWKVAICNIEFPSSTIRYDVCHSINVGIDSLLKSVHKSNQIARMVLFNISRETMAVVHNILLHCPSLTTLELKRTRLGYDGILYICNALRNNTTLRRLVIHDVLQLPPSRKRRVYYDDIKLTSFSSIERVPLPGKTTCTDFLLELNNILKDNTTLEEMKIQSGLFLPLSAGEDGEYCQWTGLGPPQQFNVGAVGSGMSPNLRRSFSSSDLTQLQTTLFWKKHFPNMFGFLYRRVDFKELFSKRKEEGKKLFSLPSFTAPDTEVLQSFSGLDPRLKECLEMSHLHQYVERLMKTCWGMLRELKYNPHF